MAYEPGTPAPHTGTVQDIHSGETKNVEKGKPLPPGPGGNAAWQYINYT